MRASELLASASESARERERIISRMEARRAAIGVHGRSGEAIAKGVSLDPMRQVDDALDGEAEDLSALAGIDAELNVAWEVIGGIAAAVSDLAAEVSCRHYLWNETWGQIAGATGLGAGECERYLTDVMDLCDRIGVAPLRQAGGWKSPEGRWRKSPRGNRGRA